MESTFPIRVNCGGKAAEGLLADRAYRPGEWGYDAGEATKDSAITFVNACDSGNPPWMKTQRVALGQSDFHYRFDVPNGKYLVRMHFTKYSCSDSYYTRHLQFDVRINGSLKLLDFMPASMIKDPDKHVTFAFPGIDAADGRIDIGFEAITGNAFINLIEIFQEEGAMTAAVPSEDVYVPCKLPLPGTNMRPREILVNCGGDSMNGFSADRPWPWPEDSWGYVGSTEALSTEETIGNAHGLESLLKSARIWRGKDYMSRGKGYDYTYILDGVSVPSPMKYHMVESKGFHYKFTLENGTYAVTLHFAEIEKRSVGERIFDVYVNDEPVLENYDILSDAGGHGVAVEKVFQANVTEGKLEIRFVRGTDRPMINALTIRRLEDRPAVPCAGETVTVSARNPRIHFVRWDGIGGKGADFGGYCSMEFCGTSIRWSGPRAPDMGKADVFIDGVFQVTVDPFGSKELDGQVLFEKVGLSDNKHTFGILKNGEKNEASNGYNVIVHSLEYAQGTDLSPAKATYHDIRPRRPFWLDTDGNRIRAALGNVMYEAGTYYWYGLDSGDTPLPSNTLENQEWPWSYNHGVAIYSSSDFYNWTYRGNVLQAMTEGNTVFSDPLRIIAYPPVVKNDTTGKYIMHTEIVDSSFGYNKVLVAWADDPTGPFHYFKDEGLAHDMSLFKDDDGKAYLWAGGQITRLSGSYLYETCRTGDNGRPTRVNEGGGMWKYDGKYYRSMSYLVGMEPSDTSYFISASPLGPYTFAGYLNQGALSEESFQTQVFHVLQVPGKKNAYVFMGTVNEGNRDSNMVWLPMRIHKDGTFEVNWVKQWDLSWFDEHPQPGE